jgi:hypothetical protein
MMVSAISSTILFEIGYPQIVPLPSVIADAIPLEMLWVAPGKFMMGASSNESNKLLYDTYSDQKQFQATLSSGF